MDSIEELADLLYLKLKESKSGELSFDEIIKILDSKPEYHLRRVEGRGIRRLREKYKDVAQLRDEKGRIYFKIDRECLA